MPLIWMYWTEVRRTDVLEERAGVQRPNQS
jgi:hypothetical protein